AQAPLAQEAVSSFYLLLNRTGSSRVRAHLEQWFRHFQTIYGDTAIAARREAEALARHYGLWGAGVDVPALFFALHTYYVTVVKLLALRVAGAVAFSQSGTDPTRVAGLGSEALREYLWENLAEGRLFRTCGLRHFHEGDFFNWYLEAWDPTLARVLSRMVAALAAYPPEALAAGPRAYPDLLKRLYQQLVPAALRHRLGEYYTPDWLAEHLLNRLEGGTFPGNLEKKVLDPACGSGTFLVLVIGRMKAHGLTVERLPAGRLLERILENVVGFDPNPLAVIAARTNYLLAIADLLPYRGEEIVIPVYRVDAILNPPSQSFDYVVGNPPWINWESLPEDYRTETRLLWQYYGLFPHGGMDAILGKGKKDL
ncbi:MAG: N-6 DNA methylase, partial [Clostridia bacterium]|nr:N-6 DNA methylase [Clostridia bacterium]